MPFIEFEKSVREQNWSMHDLHSHTHYEIYFLSKGERSFFLANALYKVSAPVLIVIPPHVMHKTEGAGFERYNVNVAPDYLDPYQMETLNARALQIVKPDPAQAAELTALFDNALQTNKTHKHAPYVSRALFSYAVYLLQNFDYGESPPTTATGENIPSLVLKVIDYLHEHYGEKLTLQALANEFFVSRATLIYNFKKYTNCSLIDFLLNIRLTKSKELLVKGKKGVEEIAELCGFSSANYFGVIFKKKEGVSPVNYRKIQRQKR